MTAVAPSMPDQTLSADALDGRRGRTHYPALDGLRGLAVLLIVVRHFSGPELPPTHLALAYTRLLSAAWTGVDLFFVLSGFLITGILLDSKGDRRFFTNFYARRALRIFPLYFLVLALFFVICRPLFVAYHVAGYEEISHLQGWLWLYGMNVAQSVHQREMFAPGMFNFGHFWSLCVEEHFYLAWPIIVFAAGRRTLGRVCFGCVAFSLIARIVLYALGVNAIAGYDLTLCRLDGLAIGSLIAVRRRATTGDRRAGTTPWWPIAGWACFAALAVTMVRQKGLWWYTTSMITWGITASGLLAGSIVYAAVTSDPAGLLRRSLGLAPLRFLGRYSYGIYVLHMPLVPIAERFHPGAVLPPSWPGAALGNILGITAVMGTVSVALAVVSYHGFEKHFLKLKGRFAAHVPGLTIVAAGPGI